MMLAKLKTEPALVTAGVLALIGVAAAFGLHTSNDQQAAIVALVGAALALVGGGVTRSKVTPVVKPPGEAGAVSVSEICLVVIAVTLVLYFLFGVTFR